MPTCFVIQPFDAGPFDKRYEDVFVPAISEAGLEAYRVDRDPAVMVPIDDIEVGIRKADACLADISLPNPNVWFELGFAIAAGKPVVLVCSHEPTRRFPFDIQHRTVITYKTDSARDFADLQKQITARLQAAMKKEERLEQLAEANVVADVQGLSQFEIVALATVAENAQDPEDSVSTWTVRHDMERAGYTKIAITLSLTTLLRKRMLLSGRDTDQNGNDFTTYRVSDLGMDWLLSNQERLVLTRRRPADEDKDVPF
jgi:nucleoside 2-deoxyribosyltransferase